jgi:chaperonin GroES
MEMELKVGDRVVFSKYAETTVKHDGKEYVVVRERDVLAVLA